MLGLAADALLGPESLQEKLCAAARNLTTISALDFPPELRPDFEEIRSTLHRKGTIRETVGAITEQEAGEIARKILDLQRKAGD